MFSSEWDAYVVCDYDPASTVKFAPVRNVSYYVPVGEKAGDFGGDEGAFEAELNFDGPIEFPLTLLGDSTAITADGLTWNSTNPYLLTKAKVRMDDQHEIDNKINFATILTPFLHRSLLRTTGPEVSSSRPTPKTLRLELPPSTSLLATSPS